MTRITNEISVIDSEIAAAEEELRNAEAALNGSAELIQKVEEAQAALEEAKAVQKDASDEDQAAAAAHAIATQARSDAQNERDTIFAQCGTLETARNEAEAEVAPAQSAYDTEFEQFKNNGGDVDAVSKAVEALDNAKQDLSIATNDVTTAEASVNQAQQEIAAKEATRDYINSLNWSSVVENPVTEPEYVYLNDHANKIRDLEIPVAEAADRMKAAEIEKNSKKLSYDHAVKEYDKAAADAKAAQDVYNKLAGITTPEKPDNGSNNGNANNGNGNNAGTNNGGTKNPSTQKPSTKPATTPAKDNGKASVKTADMKKAEEAGEAVEEADEKAVQEEVTIASQTLTQAPEKKAATFFGIDPLIAGIVGGAILVAAAAAIAAAVIRHRRANAAGEER